MKLKRRIELIRRLEAYGFNYEEANKLRRIEMTLSRWGELECGDSDNYKSWAIERDETTEKPFMVIHPHDSNQTRRYAIADREKGALRRLNKIMEAHPDLAPYHQGDPRGCCLYIVRKADLNGCDINSVYTRGVAVCD